MIRNLLTFIVLVCLVGTAFGSSQELIGLKLEHAKEDLRVSIATEKKIESEFNQLKASGNAGPEVLAYYETYLARVHAMVEENQKLVHEIEAAYGRYHGTLESADDRKKDSSDQTDVSNIEAVDEVGTLDKELNASLAAFDELLLVEIERIRARSAQKMKELAFEAADAAREAKQSAMNTVSSPGSTESEWETEMEQGQQGQQGGQQGQQGGQQGQQDRQGQQGRQGQYGSFDKDGTGQVGKEGWEGLNEQGKQQGQQGQQGKEGQPGQEGKQGQPGQEGQTGSEDGHLKGQGEQLEGQQGTQKGDSRGDTEGMEGNNKEGDQDGTIPGEDGTEHGAQGNPGSSETGAGQIGSVNHGSSQGKPQGSQHDTAQRDNRPPQYEDDDIVARQLREAAENETDPALQEKLWKEYYEYKKGS